MVSLLFLFAPFYLHGCSIVGGILWYLCSDKLYGSKGNQLMNKLHLSKRAFSGKEFICIPSSFMKTGTGNVI